MLNAVKHPVCLGASRLPWRGEKKVAGRDARPTGRSARPAPLAVDYGESMRDYTIPPQARLLH